MVESIKQVLMDRDGMSEEEASNLINEAKEEFYNLISQGNISEAEDICGIYFGLEPDYLDQLI